MKIAFSQDGTAFGVLHAACRSLCDAVFLALQHTRKISWRNHFHLL